jgi:hypothetical protein
VTPQLLAQYYRFYRLIPEVMKMVEEKKISFLNGVKMSRLPEKVQLPTANRIVSEKLTELESRSLINHVMHGLRNESKKENPEEPENTIQTKVAANLPSTMLIANDWPQVLRVVIEKQDESLTFERKTANTSGPNNLLLDYINQNQNDIIKITVEKGEEIITFEKKRT